MIMWKHRRYLKVFNARDRESDNPLVLSAEIPWKWFHCTNWWSSTVQTRRTLDSSQDPKLSGWVLEISVYNITHGSNKRPGNSELNNQITFFHQNQGSWNVLNPKQIKLHLYMKNIQRKILLLSYCGTQNKLNFNFHNKSSLYWQWIRWLCERCHCVVINHMNYYQLCSSSRL